MKKKKRFGSAKEITGSCLITANQKQKTSIHYYVKAKNNPKNPIFQFEFPKFPNKAPYKQSSLSFGYTNVDPKTENDWMKEGALLETQLLKNGYK